MIPHWTQIIDNSNSNVSHLYSVSVLGGLGSASSYTLTSDVGSRLYGGRISTMLTEYIPSWKLLILI